MDSSMVESVFDGGDISDAFSPAPVTKAKAKPGPKKATAPKTTAPRAKAAPKKTAQTTLKQKTKPAATKKRAKPDSEDEDLDAERNSLHDGSLLSATPPSAKKQKKGPAPKKMASKPLRELENGATGFDGAADPKLKKAAGATDQYQKLTQLEHIIKRPDTYIGSVERSEHPMWVYNTEMDCMEMRKVNFVPGLYKIFDEILVNAADNKQRDKNMDTIK
ncbi:MAG: hypothetical protein Q9187_009552, partial [Circinaria calcarea]